MPYRLSWWLGISDFIIYAYAFLRSNNLVVVLVWFFFDHHQSNGGQVVTFEGTNILMIGCRSCYDSILPTNMGNAIYISYYNIFEEVLTYWWVPTFFFLPLVNFALMPASLIKPSFSDTFLGNFGNGFVRRCMNLW